MVFLKANKAGEFQRSHIILKVDHGTKLYPGIDSRLFFITILDIASTRFNHASKFQR